MTKDYESRNVGCEKSLVGGDSRVKLGWFLTRRWSDTY